MLTMLRVYDTSMQKSIPWLFQLITLKSLLLDFRRLIQSVGKLFGLGWHSRYAIQL